MNLMRSLVLSASLLVAAAATADESAQSRLRRRTSLYERLTRGSTELLSPRVFVDTMVPMRDGTRLSTVAISPPWSAASRFPAVIDRSPYGHMGTELLADLFVVIGDFVSVEQDMRGSGRSEGNFSLWHSDAHDGFDTLSWITRQPWSDGRVYQIGASADGIAANMMASEDGELKPAPGSSRLATAVATHVLRLAPRSPAEAHPPSLQAQFTIFATAEARQTFFPGGAYRQGLVEGWLGDTFPDDARWLIDDVQRHEPPGAWWDAVTLAQEDWGFVKWPVVNWAGWFDIFLPGQLYAFEGLQTRSDPSVAGQHYLVIE